MENKIPEQMTAMTKNVLDAMLRLQEINDRTLRTLAEQQLEVAGSCMEAGVKKMKETGEVKDVKQAVSTQAELASELGELMINHARKTMSVLTESKDELNSLVEKNVNDLLSMGKNP
ncbi:MAG: phasin family protein [Magnetococcales bacterium]|nr:phasin family protein [Magnetococcales bacterium]